VGFSKKYDPSNGDLDKIPKAQATKDKKNWIL
jgi:hypothetical protein